MRNYWTNRKFADWLRGTPKPASGTRKEWDAWEKQAKAAHPVRYWLTEEALDKLDDAWGYIPDKISNVRYYLSNRFTVKTHALTSKLSRGKWHEFEERLLHCSFDSFVDFIEIDTAWSHVIWGNKETRDKFNVPWWRGQCLTRWFREWRCPEAGIAHLEWEMSLKYDDEWTEPSNPLYGKPTPQAEAAKEKWALYYWWTAVRPHRADVYDYCGWSAYCKEQEKTNPEGWFFETNKSKRDIRRSRGMLEAMGKLEAQYDNEDEEMLMRLVKLRKSLWT